jgi:hypothetical protein
MENKKNTKIDFVNLVVIVASLGLIIGGFYLIDQKNSRPATTTTKSSKSSIVAKIADKSSLFEVSSSSISSSTSSQSSESSSSSVSSESSSSQSSSQVTIENKSTSSPSALDPKKVESTSNLGQSQATVSVRTITDSGYQIEVLDTGYIGGKYWKKGAKININSTIPLSQSAIYTISGISENSSTVDFDLIKAN